MKPPEKKPFLKIITASLSNVPKPTCNDVLIPLVKHLENPIILSHGANNDIASNSYMQRTCSKIWTKLANTYITPFLPIQWRSYLENSEKINAMDQKASTESDLLGLPDPHSRHSTPPEYCHQPHHGSPPRIHCQRCFPIFIIDPGNPEDSHYLHEDECCEHEAETLDVWIFSNQFTHLSYWRVWLEAPKSTPSLRWFRVYWRHAKALKRASVHYFRRERYGRRLARRIWRAYD